MGVVCRLTNEIRKNNVFPATGMGEGGAIML